MDQNDKKDQIKVFTIEEVNALLPELTQLLEELQKTRDILAGQEVEIDSLELVSEKNKAGESPLLDAKVEEYNRTVTAFYETIDRIHSHGCFLKDVDLGLVDFYTILEGRVVYLCWQLGETEIGHWHEVDSGFGSRQPLHPDEDPPAA